MPIVLRKPGAPAQSEARTPPNPLKLLSMPEVASYARVSTQTVRRWIQAGDLKVYRAGRKIRIAETDLLAYLSRQD
jgi:excisionase family DNA binding protein